MSPTVYHMDGRQYFLENQKSYQIIIMDAFGSSSIPLHLVTKEAFALAKQHLGLILMNLGRCKEAISIIPKMEGLDPLDEDYAATVYRLGQCLVDLGKWEDAYIQFKILYDTTAAFEQSTREVELPIGTRVLDKNKLLRWLDKIRPHVPELAKAIVLEDTAPVTPAGAVVPSERPAARPREIQHRIPKLPQICRRPVEPRRG